MAKLAWRVKLVAELQGHHANCWGVGQAAAPVSLWSWRWCRNQWLAGLGKATVGCMGLRSPLRTLDALQIQ